jgi:hypothetical protein
MDKKIIIKTIDKLKSSVHKGREISEYLISVAMDNGKTQIEAYTELGEDAKRLRVNEILINHFPLSYPTKEDLKNIIVELN